MKLHKTLLRILMLAILLTGLAPASVSAQEKGLSDKEYTELREYITDVERDGITKDRLALEIELMNDKQDLSEVDERKLDYLQENQDELTYQRNAMLITIGFISCFFIGFYWKNKHR